MGSPRAFYRTHLSILILRKPGQNGFGRSGAGADHDILRRFARPRDGTFCGGFGGQRVGQDEAVVATGR